MFHYGTVFTPVRTFSSLLSFSDALYPFLNHFYYRILEAVSQMRSGRMHIGRSNGQCC